MKARYIVTAILLAIAINLIALNAQSFQSYLPKRPGRIGERLMLPSDLWCWPTDCYECVDYVIRPGDTLWGIARDLYPNQDIRLMVWAIQHANDMETESNKIRPWKTILVPDPALFRSDKQ